MSYSRKTRDKALMDFLQSISTGSSAALKDFLEAELESARRSIEMADDMPVIYRGQGRVMAIRDFIRILIPKQTT